MLINVSLNLYVYVMEGKPEVKKKIKAASKLALAKL